MFVFEAGCTPKDALARRSCVIVRLMDAPLGLFVRLERVVVENQLWRLG